MFWAEIEEGRNSNVVARGFAKMPNAILRNPQLSRDARLCYAILRSYAWDDGHTFVGQETLARDLGCTARRVRDYIKELEAAGLVSPERRGLNLTNRYHLYDEDVDLRLHGDGLMSLPPQRPGTESELAAQVEGDSVERKQASYPTGNGYPVREEADFLLDRKPTSDYVDSGLLDASIQDSDPYEDAGIPLALRAGAQGAPYPQKEIDTPTSFTESEQEPVASLEYERRVWQARPYLEAADIDVDSLPAGERAECLRLVDQMIAAGYGPNHVREVALSGRTML